MGKPGFPIPPPIGTGLVRPVWYSPSGDGTGKPAFPAFAGRRKGQPECSLVSTGVGKPGVHGCGETRFPHHLTRWEGLGGLRPPKNNVHCSIVWRSRMDSYRLIGPDRTCAVEACEEAASPRMPRFVAGLRPAIPPPGGDRVPSSTIHSMTHRGNQTGHPGDAIP